MAEQLIAMLIQEKMTEQALLAAEQIKEETFINTWFQRGAQVRADDSEMYVDLATQRAHLHAAEVSSSPDKIVKDWQTWMARYRALLAKNPNLARLIAPVPTTMAQISKSVQAAHAFVLEYLVGSESTVVFTMGSGGKLTATVLPVGQKKLAGQVLSLLSAMVNKRDERENYQAPLIAKNILRATYSELIPPAIKAMLPTDSEQLLLIVPDGVLFNLPFAALIDEQGKYFIENHTITLASSLTAFADYPPHYNEDLSLLLVSANTTGAVESADNEFGNDGREISAIPELFRPEAVSSLIGKDVDLKSMQEQARGRAVVHMADEMSLSAGDLWKPTLPFALSRDDSSKKASASTLFSINIPSDIFVSSASFLDPKNLDGEPLNVFSRGLNYAGVRNVLLSLWLEPGGDRTKELIDFYKNKQAGLTEAESLRRAELTALAQDPSPKTWAAFQFFGPAN